MSSYPRIKNKRVLVTGGAGFIGSNLCEDLLKYNNKVVCLDNFSNYFPGDFSERFPISGSDQGFFWFNHG